MTLYDTPAGRAAANMGPGIDPARQYGSAAAGWISFAGVMMIMVGIFQMLDGLVAILDDEFFVEARNYTFELNTTAWGWIHLGIGLIVLLAGIGVFSGNVLARTVGVLVAGLSAVANFIWLPYYPVWSIVMIAVDIAVIWALTAHGRDVTLPD
jgi:hypothetical protein